MEKWSTQVNYVSGWKTNDILKYKNDNNCTDFKSSTNISFNIHDLINDGFKETIHECHFLINVYIEYGSGFKYDIGIHEVELVSSVQCDLVLFCWLSRAGHSPKMCCKSLFSFRIPLIILTGCLVPYKYYFV